MRTREILQEIFGDSSLAVGLDASTGAGEEVKEFDLWSV